MMARAAAKAAVSVVLPSMLWPIMDGRKELVIEAATLDDLFAEMKSQHPRLHTHLFSDRGKLRPHVLCLLDGVNVRWLEDWSAPFDGPKQMTILQAVSGG